MRTDTARWNFWRADWSERIIVLWDLKISLSSFRKDIVDRVGEGFIYEMSHNPDPTEYVATREGLKIFENKSNTESK